MQTSCNYIHASKQLVNFSLRILILILINFNFNFNFNFF